MSRVRALLATSLLAALLTAPLVASVGQADQPATELDGHPEARLFDETRDADADIAAALDRAQARDVPTAIVLGANWCHDSRALAGWMETPRFKALLGERFETVFVDVGTPQDEGEGRNQQILTRFGLAPQASTPNLLIVGPDGSLLNGEDARSWGNAASRDPDAIFAYFATFAAAPAAQSGADDAAIRD